MAMLDDARRWSRRQGNPVTLTLLGLLLVAFLAAWFTRGAPFGLLSLSSRGILPWSFVTYPFADIGDGQSLFFFLLLLMWLYWVGTSLEQDLGAARFVGLWLAMTVLPAVALLLGGSILGRDVMLAGAGLPIAGLTVAWGTRYSGSQIRLYGIIPVTGAILAALTAALTLFGYGTGSPLMGVFACLHLVVAWAYAAGKIPNLRYGRPVVVDKPSKAKIEADARFEDDVRKRRQEREERERLRRLFEDNSRDDRER